MIVDREKFVFYLRAVLCIFLIALWSFWFTSSSKENTHKKNILSVQIKTTEEIFQPNEKEHDVLNARKIKELKIIKNKTNLQNKLVKELPKLVTLIPVKTTTEKNLSKPKEESSQVKEMIDLNLSEVAPATRKALSNNSKKKQDILLPVGPALLLRKETPVEKSKLKPVLINLKENYDLGQRIYLRESWLPLESKPKNETEDLDIVAEQIELSGIVNNPNGESTAIIKNKTNNYVEVLKKGDNYKGLKLLEINKNEIVFGNEILNKTYIKRINAGD